MSRLPYLRRDDLDGRGRELWDSIVAARGEDAVNDEGGLVGPFNAWVYAPELGQLIAKLGMVLRSATSLDRRLVDIAILTVGARWKAEYEWWAHARMAREHGIPAAAIEAIRSGDFPFATDGERLVHTVALRLATTGRIDEGTYAEARRLLGDRGMVELVALCGYYAMVSFTLNAFEVPLPPGRLAHLALQPARPRPGPVRAGVTGRQRSGGRHSDRPEESLVPTAVPRATSRVTVTVHLFDLDDSDVS